NSQPVHRSDRREVALGHNGNLINAVQLRDELMAKGVQLLGTSDSEVIAAMLSTSEAPTIEEAVEEVLPRLEGAFSIVVLTREAGLVKNRYVARTFIQPGDELRKQGLRMKFNPLPQVVGGKRLVVVDDSIVRGNTTRQLVRMLREAGALEVHLRISAPAIRHPCHYGVDMSTREEMVAHGRTVDEIAEELGADSLAYLSLEGVYEAIQAPRDAHCDACFSGD